MFRGSFTAGAVLALAIATPASADEDWQVTFTPYAWLAGVEGDVDLPGGGSVTIDRPFTSHLKAAFMGAIEVEHGNFVFLMDGNYLSLRSVTNDIEAPPLLEGEVTTEVLGVAPLVGYKVVNSGGTTVELLAGARYIELNNDVRLELPQSDVEADFSRATIAPLLASRLRTALGEDWSLAFYGDIGGLTDLDLTWQLLASVRYRLGEHWTLDGGYRVLSLHSDLPEGEIDARFSGPLVGVSYRF